MLRNADQQNTKRVKIKNRILMRHSQNIIHTLRDRESGFTGRSHNVHFSALPTLSYERRFYESIMPTLTVQNVMAPYLFMRKFTPDGKLLLSICNQQRSLVVWSYEGVGRAADILKDETRECIASTDHDTPALNIRKALFRRLFRQKYVIHLAIDEYSGCHVHREFSIFFDDGRYVMLVASAARETSLDSRSYYDYPDLYDDMEINIYVFFIIDLHTGNITDVRTFSHDNINVSHNHGVATYGRTIAILSKLRQYVILYHLHEGVMIEIDSYGAFPTQFDKIDEEIDVDTVPPMSQIKQRILSFMFRDIMKEKCKAEREYRLKKFYNKYPTYEKMLIDKLQLIDEDHVLIRFEEKPSELPAPSPMFKFYVFYSFSMDKILHVCEGTSLNLLFMMRDYSDQFRNARSLFTGWSSSSSSNSEPFRYCFNNTIRTYDGAIRAAAARFNQTIPISTQSYSTSPYLSYSLFAYDDRLISALERPKMSTNFPIRFCHRETRKIKFRLYLEQRTNNSTRELVAFIFHPYEPFFISIQKLHDGYFLNFHIYNRSTIVSQ